MRVYIANFGIRNSLWSYCLSNSLICGYEDPDLWPLWQAGNREKYIQKCLAEKLTAKGNRPIKPVASRWYQLGHIIADTSNDIWIHREKEELWWTTSQPAAMYVEQHPGTAVGRSGDHYYVLCKKAESWSNRNSQGKPLKWRELHPKAQQFLFTEGTMQRLSSENAAYALALIEGRDLQKWHSLPAWGGRAARAKHGECRTLSPQDLSIYRMAKIAEQTALQNNGQEVVRTLKNKDFLFTQGELEIYLKELLEEQEGLCAITDIPFQYDGEATDSELLPSLDRIDSDGHYAKGNLQVVCKFVNRWKSDSEDAEFRRLIHFVRGGD